MYTLIKNLGFSEKIRNTNKPLLYLKPCFFRKPAKQFAEMHGRAKRQSNKNNEL